MNQYVAGKIPLKSSLQVNLPKVIVESFATFGRSGVLMLSHAKALTMLNSFAWFRCGYRRCPESAAVTGVGEKKF